MVYLTPIHSTRGQDLHSTFMVLPSEKRDGGFISVARIRASCGIRLRNEFTSPIVKWALNSQKKKR